MNRPKKQHIASFVYPILALAFFIFLFPTVGQAATVRRLVINDGARATSDRQVMLAITPPRDAEFMRIGNSRDELNSARWQTVREEWGSWYLTDGAGRKTVYLQFQEEDGTVTGIYTDSITFSPTQDGFVTINDDDLFVDRQRVSLDIGIPTGARRMRISNDVDIAAASWQSLQHSKSWLLEKGTGKRTVHLQFQYDDRRISNIFQDSITLVEPITTRATFVINGGDSETSQRRVNLGLTYSSYVDMVRVSNTSSFIGSLWQEAQSHLPWTLTPGFGRKTVYVEFRDTNEESVVVKKNITLVESRATPPLSRPNAPAGRTEPLMSGMLVKGVTQPTVYYVGEEQILHPFASPAVYYSWYTHFEDLVIVSDTTIRQYAVGSTMCVRPGTWLVKFQFDPTVYAVEPGCQLRPIRSEIEAFVIYGSEWGARVLELDSVYRTAYMVLPAYDSTSTEYMVDEDKDGVALNIEESFGSEDSVPDSDHDSLSDYEEIFYWFTDPRVFDTDGDGVGDGDEILARRSPTNDEQIAAVPGGTYEYPRGTLVKRGSRYYYRSYAGVVRPVGTVKSAQFGSNYFQERFAAPGTLAIPFSRRGSVLETNDPLIGRPTRYTPAGTLSQL